MTLLAVIDLRYAIHVIELIVKDTSIEAYAAGDVAVVWWSLQRRSVGGGFSHCWSAIFWFVLIVIDVFTRRRYCFLIWTDFL